MSEEKPKLWKTQEEKEAEKKQQPRPGPWADAADHQERWPYPR